MDEEFVMISALSHYMYCQRRCALVHIEQAWVENVFTAEGRIMHDKAHEENFEIRKNIKIERGIPLRSNELGLNGKADVVEFHKDEFDKWIPFPVEYKRGKSKSDNSDKVQLCAQALCLEEILNVKIPCGALFYGQTKRREDVNFDESLRIETKETIKKVYELVMTKITPKAEYSKKCKECSLLEICLPKTFEKRTTVANYLKDIIKSSECE
ncbi:CRISPR-associated protein Cas4 [Candidatus Desantisbacteria bacterium]|nr:CRISPR-associated protein Cas4 [Candidatus Desantisbacteria bacterium]